MCPWHDAAEKYGAPNLKWCEETLCQWVSEPANTWSNLLFIILAILMFKQVKGHQNKAVKWFPYGMLIMGSGSFYYHMSNFYISQVLDFIGMFAFVYWAAMYNMVRLKWIKPSKMAITAIVFSILSSIVLHYMYLNGMKFQMIIAVSAIFIGLSELALYIKRDRPESYKFFIIGFSFIILGEIVSLLDLMKHPMICDPTNHVFQGHAVWHILSATGTYFAFLFYRQFKFNDK